jgi:hypothetical protein
MPRSLDQHLDLPAAQHETQVIGGHDQAGEEFGNMLQSHPNRQHDAEQGVSQNQDEGAQQKGEDRAERLDHEQSGPDMVLPGRDMATGTNHPLDCN